MPETVLYFYRDEDGRVPVDEWLEELRGTNRKAYAACVAILRLLASSGHELRRPAADYLRDGIYELQSKHGRVNYRILYFFDGREAIVLTHALTKEKKVPDVDINRAVERKQRYERNPQRYRSEERIPGDPGHL